VDPNAVTDFFGFFLAELSLSHLTIPPVVLPATSAGLARLPPGI
jgi:hypothetical protein